ncbi:unnamed protein product, partial [Musa hybrid cultivar]
WEDPFSSSSSSSTLRSPPPLPPLNSLSLSLSSSLRLGSIGGFGDSPLSTS